MSLQSACYETLIVLSPTVSAEENKQLIDNVAHLLQREGEILYIINWGNQKLAYVINNNQYGLFYIFYCNMLKHSVKTIEQQLTKNEHIIRCLIIKITNKYKYYLSDKLNINLC
ncbi:30S ribosomal protein S6 [Candidatus Karelsulcia muelleri]